MLIAEGGIDFIYGPDDLPIEQIDADGTPSFYHHDQLGSTVLLTNTAGSKIESVKYSAYGVPTITSGTAATPLLYGGAYTDPTTSFQYLQARWYDPATGQFLSADPLVETTGQPYGYADDDPLGFIDPTGLTTTIYVLSWGGRPFYVGRTRQTLDRRLSQHARGDGPRQRYRPGVDPEPLAVDVPDDLAPAVEQLGIDDLGTLSRDQIDIDGVEVDQNLCRALNERKFDSLRDRLNRWLSTDSGQALQDAIAKYEVWDVNDKPGDGDDDGGEVDGAAP